MYKKDEVHERKHSWRTRLYAFAGVAALLLFLIYLLMYLYGIHAPIWMILLVGLLLMVSIALAIVVIDMVLTSQYNLGLYDRRPGSNGRKNAV